MGFVDGFAFWLGKIAAEVAFVFGTLFLIVGVISLSIWIGNRFR